MESQTNNTKGRRSNNACTTCRDRKVKCSGTRPCTSCVRRSNICVYDHDEKKINISEKTITDLKRKAAAYDELIRESKPRGASETPLPGFRSISTSDAHDESNDLTTVSTHEYQLRNPLASEQASYFVDRQGHHRFLGPSSTWAYSRRLIALLRQNIRMHRAPSIPVDVDGDAYQIDWFNVQNTTNPSRKELPTKDYAVYLVNTVKFHICQIYHLFQEDLLMHKLQVFYDTPGDCTTSTIDRLWYVQLLVVLAFGKALLVQNVVRDGLPRGVEYFKLALEILPPTYAFYADPILSVELLGCISLYFQSIDQRNHAYTYLGIAMRIALTQGLHREYEGGGLDEEERHRRRKVWWTIYILDRKFSILMGAPNPIRDEDATVRLDVLHIGRPEARGLIVHVKLSRLLARIMDTVYGADGRLDITFIKSIQEMLRSMVNLAPELEKFFDLQLDGAGARSRLSATLNLSYHQCILLAVRPLLMCLCHKKLESTTAPSNGQSYKEPIKALLKTCFDSASKSIRILSSLYDHDLLETFLPFDLETLFSSAFILSILSALDTASFRAEAALTKTEQLLRIMSQRGLRPAEFRALELERLQELLNLALLERASHNQNTPFFPEGLTQVPDLVTPGSQGVLPSNKVLSHSEGVTEAIGLSPNEMASVAELLEWDQLFANIDEFTTNWPFSEPTSLDAS